MYPALNHTVVWSPDGRQILWHDIGNPSTLFLAQASDMEAINKKSVHLAEDLCFLDFELKQWSPDSQFVATVVGEKRLSGDQAVCDSRDGTNVAVLSSDGAVWLIGKQFQGQKQVIGWSTMEP
jgi:hypothetical protein